MFDRFSSAPALVLLCLGLVGCSGGDATAPELRGEECVQIQGDGQTVGHVRSLAGTGLFTFNGVKREAQVGVYLNDLEDLPNDRKRVTIVYQFWWDNGDMILTENDVILWPLFEKDRYEFDANLFVKSAMGMFEGMEGRSFLEFAAELYFGPILPQQGLGAVEEEFHASGMVCPE